MTHVTHTYTPQWSLEIFIFRVKQVLIPEQTQVTPGAYGPINMNIKTGDRTGDPNT